MGYQRHPRPHEAARRDDDARRFRSPAFHALRRAEPPRKHPLYRGGQGRSEDGMVLEAAAVLVGMAGLALLIALVILGGR